MSQRTQKLIEAMMAAGAVDESRLVQIQSLLADTDPDSRRRRLMQMYESQRSDDEATAEELDPDPHGPALAQHETRSARSRRVAARIEKLVRRQKELKAERDELRRMNRVLADALGACRLCWGLAGDCEECGGAGKPGSTPPDRELYAYFVAPTLRHMDEASEIDLPNTANAKRAGKTKGKKRDHSQEGRNDE